MSQNIMRSFHPDIPRHMMGARDPATGRPFSYRPQDSVVQSLPSIDPVSEDEYKRLREEGLRRNAFSVTTTGARISRAPPPNEVPDASSGMSRESSLSFHPGALPDGQGNPVQGIPQPANIRQPVGDNACIEDDDEQEEIPSSRIVCPCCYSRFVVAMTVLPMESEE